MTDPRINELLELAASEGFTLPLSPSLIISMEDRGYIVDLITGAISQPVVELPTIHAQAVTYLLADHVGGLVL